MYLGIQWYKYVHVINYLPILFIYNIYNRMYTYCLSQFWLFY